MILDDLMTMASDIDNTLLKLQYRNRHDLRKSVTIGITLPKEEMHMIDHDLYVTKNGNSDGFTDSDEIRVKIMGIDFVIVPEEEVEETDSKSD